METIAIVFFAIVVYFAVSLFHANKIKV